MLKVAASAFGASLLLATPASADGWGRPGWGGGWGPPVGWASGGGGCCSPCGAGCGVAVAPVVSYQPVVVVGGCGGWGGGCGAGWGPGWGPPGRGGGCGYGAPGWGGGYGYGAPGWNGGYRYGAPGWGGGYGWSASHGRGYSIGYGPAYANWGRGAGVTRRSYGFGPGVRVTRVTRVGSGARPGIIGAGFRR
jgi:hypothetical protein